jgi:outer membrane protein OmpA-like peptidoglycan-associated protein
MWQRPVLTLLMLRLQPRRLNPIWPIAKLHPQPHSPQLKRMPNNRVWQAHAQLSTQQAETDKAAMRAKLSEQLNLILQTRDSVRGLIVSMSHVLFDTRSSLKPGAREKLAKVAGILLAYPGLNIEVGGYTDNVGGDSMNQTLCENRASSVRGYLVQEGVSLNSTSAKGVGNTLPVTTTPGGGSKTGEWNFSCPATPSVPGQRDNRTLAVRQAYVERSKSINGDNTNETSRNNRHSNFGLDHRRIERGIRADLLAPGQPIGSTRQTFMSSTLTACITCATRCIRALTLNLALHCSAL